MCRMGAPTANYLSVFAVSAPTPTWICGKVPVSKASGNLFVKTPEEGVVRVPYGSHRPSTTR